VPDTIGAIERSIISQMATIALAKKHLKKLMRVLDKRESSNEAKNLLIKNPIRQAHTLKDSLRPLGFVVVRNALHVGPCRQLKTINF
jgi:hypothetical protein